MKFKLALGQKVRDKVSGRKGTITAKSEIIHNPTPAYVVAFDLGVEFLIPETRLEVAEEKQEAKS